MASKYFRGLLLSMLVGMTCSKAAWQEQTLQRQMFNATQYPQYDSGVRPFQDSFGGPVLVEIDAVMISVGPVNEMDMTWTASFYFRQEWTDPRLILNSTTTLTKAMLGYDNVARVWRPDVYFSNSKEDRKHDITVPNNLVYVNITTGRVLYSQRLTVVLNCEMNLEKFPHDTQICELMIESYSYSTEDLVLKWSSSRSATNFLPTAFIPDFSITAIDTLDCTTTYAIGTFPCLKALVTMERKIGYYITQNYIPTVLIVVLSWASFWINHEAVPARISVGLLTVLTITTQLSGSRAQLPKVPYIKAIDVWMSMNLVFVFAAYMEYAVVTVLSRRYKKIQAGHKPRGSIVARFRRNSKGSLDNLTTETEKSDRKANENGTNQSSSITHVYANEDIVETRSPLPSSKHSQPSGKAANIESSEIDFRDTGRRVDKFSRFAFPFVFVVFNTVYWVYYMRVV